MYIGIDPTIRHVAGGRVKTKRAAPTSQMGLCGSARKVSAGVGLGDIMGRKRARSGFHPAEKVLADVGIGHRIVRKADGPGAPGSARGYPGNPAQQVLATAWKERGHEAA